MGGSSLTFGVEERGDAQVPLGHAEGVLQVVAGVGFGQVLKVNQLGPGDRGCGVVVTHLWDIPRCHHLGAHCSATYLCLWMRALKASPSFQLEVKLVTFTWGYLQWGQSVTVTFWRPWGPGGVRVPPPTPLSSSGTKAAARLWRSASPGPPASPR